MNVLGGVSTYGLVIHSELLESKPLTPAVGARFPLAEARQAQELAQTRHGRGRIILLTA